jgi:hypothetical protein
MRHQRGSVATRLSFMVILRDVQIEGVHETPRCHCGHQWRSDGVAAGGARPTIDDAGGRFSESKFSEFGRRIRCSFRGRA